MKCIGCQYYDDSVDCCNADDFCIMDGYEKAQKEMLMPYDAESIEELIQNTRNKVVDECKKAVKDYFIELLEEHEEWEIDKIDDYALIPNKNICKAIEQLKSVDISTNKVDTSRKEFSCCKK